MKPNPSRLLVILLAVIVITYLWWHDDISHRSVSTIESISGDSRAEATPVPAGELEARSDVIDGDHDIDAAPSMDLPDGIIVHGWVKNQLGQGISGMQIEVTPKVAPAMKKNFYSASTDHTGQFLFNSISPGNEYRLEVLASGGYAGTLLDPFPIDHDMSPVTITLDSVELVTLDGMIVDADNAPVANFEILVQNVGLAYPGRKIVSDSSGFFRLARFPAGDLHLSTTGNEHFQISGIVLRPDVYRNLTLALDKGNFHLSGWISDEFDTPIAQARIVLTSVLSRQDYRSSSYRLKVADSNGNFVFSGLGGQGHRLVVDAMGYETRVLDYRFQSFSDSLIIQMKRKR